MKYQPPYKYDYMTSTIQDSTGLVIFEVPAYQKHDVKARDNFCKEIVRRMNMKKDEVEKVEQPLVYQGELF